MYFWKLIKTKLYRTNQAEESLLMSLLETLIILIIEEELDFSQEASQRLFCEEATVSAYKTSKKFN